MAKARAFLNRLWDYSTSIGDQEASKEFEQIYKRYGKEPPIPSNSLDNPEGMPQLAFDPDKETTYLDRLRIRTPGDSKVNHN